MIRFGGLCYPDSPGVSEDHRQIVEYERELGEAESNLYAGLVRAALDAPDEESFLEEIEKFEPADRAQFFRAFAAARPECQPGSFCDRMASGTFEEMAQAIVDLEHDSSDSWAKSYLRAREEVEKRRQQLIGRMGSNPELLALLGSQAPLVLGSQQEQLALSAEPSPEEVEAFEEELATAREAENRGEAMFALLEADSKLSKIGSPPRLVQRLELTRSILADLWDSKEGDDG